MAKSGRGIIVSLDLSHKYGGDDKRQNNNLRACKKIYGVIDKHRHGHRVQA
jgi:hypothetical protein